MKKKILALLLAIMLVFSTIPMSAIAEDGTTLDEISSWAANGGTLTLSNDVQLTDVITIDSTKSYTLNLGTYTITAASGKDAVKITGSGSNYLTINADTENPGGISASGTTVINVSAATGGAGIIINGGKFSGKKCIWNSTNTGIFADSQHTQGTANPTILIYGGEFSGTSYDIGCYRPKLVIYGGIFNGTVSTTGTSTYTTIISGGKFKQVPKPASNHTFGTAIGTYDRDVWVDSDGWYVVTETSATPTDFAASVEYSSLPSKIAKLGESKVGAEKSLDCATITQAIENADKSYTKNITLKNNATLTVNDVQNAITKNIVFDINGYTLTLPSEYVLDADGKITERPELPTAEVKDISAQELKASNAPALTFAKRFTAVTPSDEAKAFYGKWFADYVITINKTASFNADGTADGYLAGQYDDWSNEWISVPFETVKLEANQPIKIMETAAELMGKEGLKVTYNDVLLLEEFNCGIYFTDAFLKANPDLIVTLELRMYNNEDESESYVIGESYTFKASEIEDDFTADVDGETVIGSVSDIIEKAEADITNGAEKSEIKLDTENISSKDKYNELITDIITGIKESDKKEDIILSFDAGDGNITLDPDAIDRINNNLDEDSDEPIVLVVEDVTLEEPIEGAAAVYEIHIMQGDNELFADDGSELLGNATITVPIPEDVENPVIYYINGNEKVKVEKTQIVGNSIKFTVNHFSTYIVEEEAFNPTGSIASAVVGNHIIGDWVTIYSEAVICGKESMVVKVYSFDTYLGYTELVDTQKVLLNGKNNSVTYHIFLAGHDDWWNTQWEIEPVANMVPTKVELWVDGVMVGENTVSMNNSNDNLGSANVTYNYGDLDGVYVAKIGSNYYDTIQEAIDAAQAGDTVTLLGDITVNAVDSKPETHAWVKADDDVIIDLNGKTVTGAFFINGTATIKNGTIINNSLVSGIETEGNLSLEDMIISSNRHAVRVSDGTVVINSGKYTTTANSSTSGYALNIKSDTGAVVTVNGGEFYGSADGAVAGKSAVTVQKSIDKIIINGGNFYSGATEGTVHSIENYSELSEIKGGSFYGSLANGYKNITGGSFSADPTLQLVEGFVAVENTEGFYEVFEAVAKIEDKIYASLEAAITAANEGDTIVVIAKEIELPKITKAGLTFKSSIGTKVTNKIDNTNSDYGWRMTGTTFDGFEFTQSFGLIGKDITVKNCQFTGQCGLYYAAASGTWTIDNCVFNPTYAYGISVGDGNSTINISNSEITSWNSFGKGHTVNFDNCTFVGGSSSYSVLRTYNKTTITDCKFEASYFEISTCAFDTANVANAVIEVSGCDIGDVNLFDYVDDIGIYVIDPEKDTDGKYTAGTFAAMPSTDILADGYIPVINADGTYGVVKAPPTVDFETRFLTVRDSKLANTGAFGSAKVPYTVMFAFGIDSLDYANAGFEVTIGEETQKFYIKDKDVWEDLTVNGITYTATDFGEDCNYIVYYAIVFDEALVNENPEMTVRGFVQDLETKDYIYVAGMQGSLVK